MTTQTQTRNVRRGEAGNVLFLILIAVALFAALSYAVTQSTRSGGGDASKEKSLVNSAALTQYPASIKTAITRMTVSNGIAPEDLNFEKPGTTGWDDLVLNADAVTSTPKNELAKNAVFHPEGGGVVYSSVPKDVLTTAGSGDWIINGYNSVKNIGTTTGTTPTQSTADIIAFVPNMSKGVCQKIHEQLGLKYLDADAADAFPIVAVKVDVSKDSDSARYAVPGTTAPSGGAQITSTVLDGQPQGCVRTAASTYVYYHVLVER